MAGVERHHFSFGRGELLAIVSVLGYTTVNGLVRTVSTSVDPFGASLARQIPLLLIATVAILVMRPPALRPATAAFMGAKNIWLLIGAGVISFLVGNVSLIVGFAWAGLSFSVVALQGGMVVGGVALSAWVLKEQLHPWQLVGAAVVLLGLGATLIPAVAAQGVSGIAIWGFLAAALAGICFTVANIVSRHVQTTGEGRFLSALWLTNLSGTLALFVVVLVQSQLSDTELLAVLTGTELLVMIAVGFANAVALASMILATKHTSVAAISTISSLVIVTSLVVGRLVFAESQPFLLLIGALLIIAGVVVSQLRLQAKNSTT